MDKSALGAEGAPFELDVERGKLYEFARATLARAREHYDRESSVIPPTFLTSAFHWELLVDGANPWARVGMNLERGMHAEQEYIFHGPPPRAGTRLRCQSKISELYEKAGRRGGKLEFCVMETEFRDAVTGRLVATARMTGVETERAPEAPGGAG